MKRKNFILFIMFIFVLISVLLVSCGPKKKYAPVASVMTQGTLDVPFKKPSFGVAPKGLTDSGVSVAPGPTAPAVLVAPGPTAPAASDDVAATADVDPDNETPEESMQKEKEIGEIKGKIPVEVKEILKKHSLAGTDVSKKLIIPEFGGHFVKKFRYSFFVDDKEEHVYFERNLGVLSTLFWDLLIDDGVKGEYLKEDNFELQKEFYLALEYNDDLLKPFAYVYGRLSYDVANRSSYDQHTKNEIVSQKNDIVDKLRNYAKAYYIDVYQSLLAKKDKLDKLLLKDVRFLKSKLNEIELAKQKLRTDIIQQFVNGVKNYEPYSLDSKHDVWPHLRDTFNDDFKTKLYYVIDLAADIKNILDRI
ncbi:virulence associated lipoprotein [Borrelia hispanica]|uniref:virulence associated lipoprotein n=1 Tax=Borrelia hispanica TaxID=40835 RepID=UPI0004647859|nr:virulence associated lipoprotein [Borrelia hispanica]